MNTISIDHFSDTLCVWAYIAQARIDELKSKFGDQVSLNYHFIPVFGSAHHKIDTQWLDRGGRAGYAKHVLEVVEQFGHVDLHEDIWVKDTPESSLPSHLIINALRTLEIDKEIKPGCSEAFTWSLRKAFFSQCRDISNRTVLNELLEEAGIPLDKVEQQVQSGKAFALLAENIKLATDKQVRSSPTLIFNEDRQRLTGNVGYRIIEANVRELLSNPVDQNSWC